MKPILIVENNTNPLSVNESAITSKSYILDGIFTEFDIKNRNERIYTSPKFLPCLEELNERITSIGAVYGEFDHPDVFDTSLSRASHLINKAFFVKESNRVEGQIKLLSTYWGKEARSLVDDGCPIFVSSRAAGITESDGTVTLKKLFTYDIVADPGFASAKMSSVNESLGYTNKNNFRIYEMSDESKINELFNMNKSDFVTKKQLSEYSEYLVKQISETKRELNSATTKRGEFNPKKMETLLEYYDELNNTSSQIVKYLDYLAEKVQVVVNENKSLKSTTKKLITHNDYLAENLEKAINYGDYLAENLDKNIEYSEYIVENLQKNISYSEYLAENLDKNIEYSEYIAENLDKNISYSEYIAENLDKNIEYSEYIAEHLDSTILYSEYIAENLDGNIAYSEYIAEHLDDNIAYSEYIAENLDKTVSYAGLISEKLNDKKLFENKKNVSFPTLEEIGFEEYEEDEFDNDDFEDQEDDFSTEDEYDLGDENEFDNQEDDKLLNNYGDDDSIDNIDGDNYDDNNFRTEEEDDDNFDADENDELCDEDGNCYEEEIDIEEAPSYLGESESELSLQIDKLIEEAKKRKVSETSDLHFLKFLNKSQVDSYYGLSLDEQEQVKLYINEKSYFKGSDVIKLISEALTAKNESLEEKLIRLMPASIKPIWNQMNESAKKSILSQGRLYPNLDSDMKVEHFWLTRSIKKNESKNKKMISHESLIQEDKLSNNEVNLILERFKNIK